MSMKILVVDDEDLLVKGIRFNLQNDGYEVISGLRTTGDGYDESYIVGIEGNQIEITE